MEFIAKDGFLVERIQGRWFTNFIRLLLHTRSIMRGRYKMYSNPQAVGWLGWCEDGDGKATAFVGLDRKVVFRDGIACG